MWIAAGALCAAVGVGAFLRSEYERGQLSLERTVIESRKLRKDCTFVFLSDLHNHEFGIGNSRLFEAICRVNPDAVLIGGDMMVSKGGADLRVSLELVGRLAKRYPVYYGNGNHENRMLWEPEVYGSQYRAYEKSLQAMGVFVLGNQSQSCRSDIVITGIDLEPRFYQKLKPDMLRAGEIEKKVGKADSERFQILLCHSPLFFDACRQWGADLTLSGHFHGGTIRLPILGGVMTPQYQFFLPCCAGEFEEDGKYMIVSRGLGTHSINIRLNNKPQLVVVDLKTKA